MTGQTIRFYQKDVYGNPLLYPVDFPVEIYEITGKKTLTERVIRSMERMGFVFVEVLESSIKGGK